MRGPRRPVTSSRFQVVVQAVDALLELHHAPAKRTRQVGHLAAKEQQTNDQDDEEFGNAKSEHDRDSPVRRRRRECRGGTGTTVPCGVSNQWMIHYNSRPAAGTSMKCA